jgi:hypothetical protein
MWEKAVADGDVEQMFGMNIKQEGIEVQGDQVGPAMPSGQRRLLQVGREIKLTLIGRFRALDPCMASYLGTSARLVRWRHS